MNKFKHVISSLFFVSILFTYQSSIAVTKVINRLAEQSNTKDNHQQTDNDSINKHFLHTLAPTLSNNTLDLAVNAYKTVESLGQLKKPVLTVIDYSLPSSKKRLWVFDIPHKTLLYNTFVAHGKNSGNLYSTHFSNISESKTSSIGAYLTQNTYFGGKGLSLNLKGLEKGYNDNAFHRRIVMHGAWYADSSFIKSHGRAGRSWGCPAVSPSMAKPIINTIKDGSLIFAYYPDKKYLSDNHLIHHA